MEATLETARSWLKSVGILDGEEQKEPAISPDPREAMQYLEKINNALPPKTEMLNIPLNDMKIVTSLLKIVVVFGLFPANPIICDVTDRIAWKLPQTTTDTTVSDELAARLTDILIQDSDLSDLIRISPFLLDIIAITVSKPELIKKVAPKLSTYVLYENLSRLLKPLKSPPEFTNAVAQQLALLPLERNDALRALIELVTGFRHKEQPELNHVDKATAVLSAPPKGVALRQFAIAVGSQLFKILSQDSQLAEPATVLTILLADARPAMVGFLRDRIVNPFKAAGSSDIEASLFTLTKLSARPQSSFFAYLSRQLIVPVWLLLVTLENNQRPNGSTLRLIAKMFDAGAGELLVTSGCISASRWLNMDWKLTSAAAALETSIPDPGPVNLALMSKRLDILVTIIDKVGDKEVTSWLVALVKQYTSHVGDVLATAQVLQHVLQDESLRGKLFGDPIQIVDLALGLLKPKPESLETKAEVADLGDSDDEEDQETGNDDDSQMIDLSLSLLNGVILEASGSQPVVDRLNMGLQDLERLSRSQNRSISEKATLCLQLLKTLGTGNLTDSLDEQVDMSNVNEVLRVARRSLAEPLVPARAHGQYLIGELVKMHQITLDDAMDVYLQEIKYEDSFIYLNSIKGIELCAGVFGTGPVFKRLLTAASTITSPDQVDNQLHIREAVTRLVQGQYAIVSEDYQLLANYLLSDLRVPGAVDYRLRLSSISILGWLVGQHAQALLGWQETEIVDCALGILNHEREDAPMKRGALVLTLELLNGRNSGLLANVPAKTIHQLLSTASQFVDDPDETVREHAKAVIDAST